MIDVKQAVENEVEKTEEAPKFDPVQMASQIFETYFPIYCQQLDKLSRKQIVRLTKAVMGLPLEEGFKPNLKDPMEMQAFFVAEKLFQAKMVITHSVLLERQRELAEKAKTEEGEKT
jgi:hypothetical protein